MTRNLLGVFEKCRASFELTPAEREVLNEEINKVSAMLSLFEGKHALAAGKTNAALTSFRKANVHLRRPKLSAAIFLLRYAPGLISWAYTTRERLFEKHPEHQLKGIDKPRTPSGAELSQ